LMSALGTAAFASLGQGAGCTCLGDGPISGIGTLPNSTKQV
jgi:hypothetical protein